MSQHNVALDGGEYLRSGAHAAFESVRAELRAEFGQEEYRSWFENLSLLAEHEGSLYFVTPSATARDWLRRNGLHRLEARLAARLALSGPIVIATPGDLPDALRERAEEATPSAELTAARGAFLFDNFCVGPSNQAAFTAARAIARNDTAAFPLTLLHGAPGVGKTHLQLALIAESHRLHPSRRVRYMMSQIFIEEFQAALHKRRDSSGFKSMVRENDLLVLDDVQRIAGKRATEEEFFDTIAVVAAQGGQVVLSADHGAEGLNGFNDRLRVHLKGAVECAIAEPDFELRRRILDSKVLQYAACAPSFTVPGPVLDMIAARVRGPGRLLDGAVRQLLVEAGMAGREVTMELAESVLKSRFSAAEKRPTVDLIIKTTAKHFALTPQELLSRSRRRTIARPRQIAMFVCTRLTTRSLPDIGNRFGGFDHTTVLYARDRVAALVETDAQLREEVEAVERAVRANV